MNRHLYLAAQVASSRFDLRRFRVGAVAIRSDGVIVASYNGSDTMPALSAHAEVRVLRKAGKGATLFVARVGAKGELRMAKPCKTCQAMCRSKGVKVVYFTTNEGVGQWVP